MKTAIAVLAASSGLALAGVAAAATPQQIYADAADNGRLDHTYSAADLARFQHDATVAGYGNQIIKIVVKPKTTPRIKPAAKQVVKPKKTMPRHVYKPAPKQAVAPQKKAPPQVYTPPCVPSSSGSSNSSGSSASGSTGTSGGAVSCTPSKSALPFTGSNLATYVAIGIALIAGGFLLRMMSGRRSSVR
jgi:hypothetical protein